MHLRKAWHHSSLRFVLSPNLPLWQRKEIGNMYLNKLALLNVTDFILISMLRTFMVLHLFLFFHIRVWSSWERWLTASSLFRGFGFSFLSFSLVITQGRLRYNLLYRSRRWVRIGLMPFTSLFQSKHSRLCWNLNSARQIHFLSLLTLRYARIHFRHMEKVRSAGFCKQETENLIFLWKFWT